MHVIALLQDLLAAGTDTTSVTLQWAMAELIRNPKLMKCAQDELDTVVATDRVVEESDLQHLPYLQAIIKETFRFHPAAPFTIPHMSLESCQVAGYYMPPKTRVIVNLWGMGRNPDVWERPLEFDPERFLEHPEIDWNGHSFELLPFGSGRRACPGQPLAELVIQLALAHLVHSFNWSLPNQQEPHTLDMSDKFGLSLPRAQPLHAMAHPRLPTHLY
jgi:cytochrome P450